MRRSMFALLVALCVSSAMSSAKAEERQNGFTPAQVAGIAKTISDDKDQSEKWKWANQWFDVGAKLLVFGLAAAAAVGAAKVASLGQETVSAPLKMFNSVVTSLATLVTAVAFTQFDFPKRQAVWERRFHTLESCEMVIRYRQPEPDKFLAQLEVIRKWGDSTNLAEMNASCTQDVPSAKPSTRGAQPSAATSLDPTQAARATASQSTAGTRADHSALKSLPPPKASAPNSAGPAKGT